ncbi:MAG: hypothetical protein KBT03_05545 [Bacteroidales bacterium]|nr:hypothetical protein [Candidatus Scybalousia scybalohippi]
MAKIYGDYATVELTKVASRKTGEIEAQCELDAAIESLENGAIMFIDAEKDTIVDTYSAKCVDAIYLHFSNPRRYGELESGMANFIYKRNDDYETMGVKYLPRLFKLTTGDLFTTDFKYSSLTFGNHEIVKVKDTTMPNGKAGVLYRVVK